jgi:2-polyprenyl-3-methyl-5-hydroxy-6-metoxy-1,4-benzoquinol methylase
MDQVTCNVCDQTSSIAHCETATVRSNVRVFRDERFAVWRCPGCRSIRARDEVDLGYYYARYPTFPRALEGARHPAYAGFLRRLVEAGLRKEHRILDYGCSSGAFVRFLQQHGYTRAEGYDAFTEPYQDVSVLKQTYDVIVSQDVIEHVDAPRELLRRFDGLVASDGLIVIGTPDASAINLSDPDDYVHTLHAPYHRHILTHEALRTVAAQLGWGVQRYYETMYGNTLMPGQNPRFGLSYMRAHDDTLDVLTEPLRFSWRLLHPLVLFFLFFGFFFDRHTDVMFVFRKSQPEPATGRDWPRGTRPAKREANAVLDRQVE